MLQLCRSVIEWVLGVAAAFAYFRGQIDKIPEPRIVPEVEVVQHGFDPAVTPMTKKTRTVPPGSTGPPTSMTLLLIGPAELRGWLVLGALLYWLFLAGWWFALSAMPIGDATTIVYVGPIFTATFAYLFLGERIDWTFYPIVLLDGAGLLCITQPTFIFGGTGAAGDAADASSGYFLGALSAFLSAVVAGLLPVCTRKSKACFWTAVNHCSSLLSALVFTPLAITIWFFVDPNANAAVAESLHELVPPAVGGGSFEPAKWALLISATVIGFAGLAMQTMGYQLEEAARASVMTVLESARTPTACRALAAAARRGSTTASAEIPRAVCSLCATQSRLRICCSL